jgi:hypothetical protein
MSPLWVHNGSVELDHESRYKQIMAVSITLTVVMSIAVSLRAYVRTVMLKTLGADDWVIFVTAVSPLPLRRSIESLITKSWYLAV